MKNVDELRQYLVTVSKLASALGVLGWDQEVNIPPKGMAIRGEVNALLSAEVHRRFTDPKFIKALRSLNDPKNFEALSATNKVIVREAWRDVRRAQKLPTEFVEKFSRLTTEAFSAWAEARQNADFKIYKPYLAKIIDMCWQEAEYIGYKDSPYDALLDGFEPGMTSKKLDALFGPLTEQLAMLISGVKNKPTKLPKFDYPIADQQKLNETVVKALGYDLEAGRIDASPHPFTTGFHPTDVRVTTRYDEHDFWVSMGSVIHEVGHALYEQGLPAKQWGTPLGEAASLGVHESQSRLWENFVGRSEAFVSYMYPLLRKQFGKLPYTKNELYAWLNRVQPNLIRVESDEVTYNLHIALRYEIEKGLMSGEVKVNDLPAIWNEKVKNYLGLKVPNDSVGVLQDVHWSHGTLGYFPTYTLGNLYSAQLFNKMSQEIPGLQDQFAAGNFEPCLVWLRKNIHVHGRRYQPEELIKKATGENLNSEYLLNHLRQKALLN